MLLNFGAILRKFYVHYRENSEGMYKTFTKFLHTTLPWHVEEAHLVSKRE